MLSRRHHLGVRGRGRAFNHPDGHLVSNLSVQFTLSGTAPPVRSSFSILATAGAVLFVLFLIAAAPTRLLLRSRSVATARIAAPDAHLRVGSTGKIDGKNYTIVSDALVEMNEVGVIFQRHEFHLRDEDGNGALLIRGWKPGDKDWCLLTLRDPSTLMTPQQAAAVQCGQVVPFPDTSVAVDALYRFVTLKVDTADILQSATGMVFYGCSGGTGVTVMLARWNEDGVNFYEGRQLNGDPTPAFTAPLEK